MFLACVLVITLIIIGLLLKVYAKQTLGICRTNTSLIGKTALVTGGNQGIGFHTALGLATRGCRVIIADIDNSDASRKLIIQETQNPNIISKQFDLSSIDSVKSFAADILKTEKTLDILINNAGIATCGDCTTKDGFNFIMQVNYFGPFLLTYLLVELLKKTPKSRIIFTSSSFSFAHILNENSDINKIPRFTFLLFSNLFAYNNSKLCNIICAQYFAKKLYSHGVVCNSTYPGAVYTNIIPASLESSKSDNIIMTHIGYNFIRCLLWGYAKTPQEGAQTNLHVATSMDAGNNVGEYFCDCHVATKPRAAKKHKLCNSIIKQTLKLLKLEDL